MAEYIERDKVLALSEDFEALIDDGADEIFFEYIPIDKVRSLPAADVRPVVMCRDCKWCHAGYCEKYDDLIPFGCANKPWEDWFCAGGEKREES